MKKLFVFALATTLSVVVLAQEDKKQEVLKTEKQRFQAMVDRDSEVLNDIISDDLSYIRSNGFVETKESFINAVMNKTKKYDDITIEKTTIRMYGRTGVIYGDCTYHRKDENGNSNNVKLRYTDVYANIDGKWKFVAWQSCELEE